MIFNGKFVPHKIQENRDLTCDNAFCQDIGCFTCINYPTGIVKDIKDSYLEQENMDERI